MNKLFYKVNILFLVFYHVLPSHKATLQTHQDAKFTILNQKKMKP